MSAERNERCQGAIARPAYGLVLAVWAVVWMAASQAQEVRVAAPVDVPGAPGKVRGEETSGGAGAPAPAPATQVLPPSIEAMQSRGAVVLALGEAEGLEGFLVRQPGGGTYAAYVTGTGAVVVGLLYGVDGEVVTRRQLAEADEAGRLGEFPAAVSEGERPGAGAMPEDRIAALAQATREAPGFRMGHRGPVIHAFVDPTCPFSVRHVRSLKRDAAAGRLQAHVIPVGILGERGARRAVEVAGSRAPVTEWEEERGEGVDRELGAARVAANNALLGRWRVTAVPFSVWEGPQGVRVWPGAGEASMYAADVVRGG